MALSPHNSRKPPVEGVAPASFSSRRAARLGDPLVMQGVRSIAFSDSAPAQFINIAAVTAAMGLDGGLRVKPLDPGFWLDPAHPGPSQSILPRLKEVWLHHLGQWRKTKLLRCEARGRGFYIELACCENRSQAESLRGATVGAPRPVLPLTNPPLTASGAPALWADLIGRGVMNLAGMFLGQVERLDTNGVHDWLVLDEGKVHIPLVERHVMSLCDENGRILVDWQPDWLD